MLTRISILLLIGLTVPPLYAHPPVKPTNIGKVKITRSVASGRVLQDALRHAQALRQIQLDRGLMPSPPQPKPPQERTASIKNTPQEWLNELEEFIRQNNRFPRSSNDHKDFPLYSHIYHVLQKLDPQDPVAVRIRELKEQYAFNKTPQQWLELLEGFIAQHQRYPSTNRSPQEMALCANIQNVLRRLNEQDPIAVRIRQLREQYPSVHYGKTPQQWLDELENFVQKTGYFPSAKHSPQERQLKQSIYNVLYRLDKENPIAKRIRQLHRKYPAAPFGKTSQQWLDELENFVQQNGRFPNSAANHIEYPLYKGMYSTLKKLDPQDPIAVRIRQLQQQYAVGARRKTPQQWLNELEDFIAQHGYFPRPSDPQEHAFYTSLLTLTSNPATQVQAIGARIRQLQQQYSTVAKSKTPQQRLSELEDFIAQHGHFPRSTRKHPQEYRMYGCVMQILKRLSPQDPVAVRIRQLRRQYAYEVSLKTPQQWLSELEDFIAQYQRYPSTDNDPEEAKLAGNLAQLSDLLDPQDPVAVRMRELKEQVQLPSQTPQEVLGLLEEFVQQNGWFPGEAIDDKEYGLYVQIHRTLSHLDPQDPIAMRIQQLRQNYSHR